MDWLIGLAIMMQTSAEHRGVWENLVPRPAHVWVGERTVPGFRLDDPSRFHPALTTIDSPGDTRTLPLRLAHWQELDADTKQALPEQARRCADDDEAYVLALRPNGGLLAAGGERGLQHGLVTLRWMQQLADDGGLDAMPETVIVDGPAFPIRGAHVCYHDVRGWLPHSAPDYDALRESLVEFARLKFNTVLLELEAFFPYQDMPDIASPIAFSTGEIDQLVQDAQRLRLSLIAMVQCLGHQYDALTHPAYAHLRETPDSPQQLCPSNPGSVAFVLRRVDELRRRFVHAKYFHLGGDEAMQLGHCPSCAAKVDAEGVSALYVDHVAACCRGVIERGLVPIVWSDMLEQHPEALDRLPRDTVIAYWRYEPDTWPRPYTLPRFVEAGFRVWGFPAVRFGGINHAVVPSVQAHRGIIDLTRRAAEDGADGMVITNWMKAVPYALSWRGYGLAAWTSWSGTESAADYDTAFHIAWHGLGGASDPAAHAGAMAEVADLLALPVPYAEEAITRLCTPLNRYDLSCRTVQDRIAEYTSTGAREMALVHARLAQERGADALQRLMAIEPYVRRHNDQYAWLVLAAHTVRLYGELTLAFDDAEHWRRGERELDTVERPALIRRLDAIRTAWLRLRVDTLRFLQHDHHPQIALALLDHKFDPDFLTAIARYRRALLEAHGE